MAINYQTPYTGITARTAATLASADMTFAGVKIDGSGDPLKTDYSDVKEAVQAGVVIGFIQLLNSQASGTASGNFTSGSPQTRVINTKAVDTLSRCTLASNQFTLLAGKYIVEAFATVYAVDNHKLTLYNVTGATVDGIGINCRANAIGTTAMLSSGVLTLASSTTYQLRHQCQTTKTINGFGGSCAFGYAEIYTTINIQVLGD